MYGHTAESASKRQSATGAKRTTDATSAIAVAASGSRSRPRIRFQSAWRKADPSARAKASSGGRDPSGVGSRPDEDRARARLRLQRDAVARRARPFAIYVGASSPSTEAADRGDYYGTLAGNTEEAIIGGWLGVDEEELQLSSTSGSSATAGSRTAPRSPPSCARPCATRRAGSRSPSCRGRIGARSSPCSEAPASRASSAFCGG